MRIHFGVAVLVAVAFMVMSPPASAADCKKLADGDAAFEKACEAFRSGKNVADDALSETQRVMEETAEGIRSLRQRRVERSEKLRKLNEQKERERRRLLWESLCDTGGCVGI